MRSFTTIIASALALAGSSQALVGLEGQRAMFEAAKAGYVGETKYGYVMPRGNHVETRDVESPLHVRAVGGNTKRIYYGPYTVPDMSQDNGMKNFFKLGFATPCSDCYVTKVVAGMEHADGKYANANTSLWLHHMVVWDESRTDTVCGSSYYGMGNRWFASGNERTKVDMSMLGRVKAGYYLPAGNSMHMLVEIMNQAMTSQTGKMWVEYTYVPAAQAKAAGGFSDVNTYWLDISGCMGASDMPAKTQSGSFSYQMTPGYTVGSGATGQLLEMGGHLHDGGKNLQIVKNGKMVCNSRAYYGETPGYYDAPGSMMSGNSDSGSDSSSSGGSDWLGGLFGGFKGLMGKRAMPKTMSHISTMWGCVGPSIGAMKQGDSWNLNAQYDYKFHAGMLDNSGKQLPIMGIAVMYAAKSLSAATIKSAMKNVKYPHGVSQAPGPSTA